jgi:predicted dehydrogenase
MRRRTFLERAGYAGFGALASRGAASAATGPVRVGVVTEPGGAHLDLFVRALGACEGVDTVALCDPSGASFERSKKSLSSRAATARTFGDYREMLREQRPEIVVMTLEPVHTPPVIEAALEAGAHVLAEKPPCVRQADFERLVALAQAKKRHLMLAFATRVTPPARKARELVEQGYLGKLYGVSMTWIADQTRLRNPAYHKTWTAQKARAGGGQLIFHGVHYIDLIQYIAGSTVTRVSGFVRNVGGQPIDVEDAAVVALEFSSGMVGTLNTGYYLDKNYDNRITVWGSEGWLRFGFTSTSLPLEWYSTRSGAPKGVQTFSYSDEPDGYYILTREAVAAARGLAQAPMTGAECLAVMKAVFAAYRAAGTGVTQKV